MKALIYFESLKAIKKSGIGRARTHQVLACQSAGIDIVDNPKDPFDIAHINTYGGKSYRLLKRCLKKNIPVVVHGHSTLEDWQGSFLAAKLIEPFYWHNLKRMYGNAPTIITPTPHSKRNIDNYHLCDDVRFLSNGISLEEYAPDQEKVKAFRQHFNLKDDEKFVMGVGFPFVRKGLVDFIEVAREFPDVKFFWFGHLPWVAVSKACKKAIRNKPDNVILPGYVAGPLIKGAYQTTSCFFFPSYEENEGIVVLEALASRCPILVRDIDTYVPWLNKDKTCHMGYNNDEFKKELHKLLENGEDPAILDEAYKVAEERSIDKIGEKLKEIYSEVIANQSKK